MAIATYSTRESWKLPPQGYQRIQRGVAIKLFHRFPKVDAVVIHTEMDAYLFKQTVRELKRIRHDVPMMGIYPRGDRGSGLHDFKPRSACLLQLFAQWFEVSVSDLGDT